MRKRGGILSQDWRAPISGTLQPHRKLQMDHPFWGWPHCASVSMRKTLMYERLTHSLTADPNASPEPGALPDPGSRLGKVMPAGYS